MPFGPIDLEKEIPPGCVCTRECWDRILTTFAEFAEEGETPAAHICGTHGVRHRFEVNSEGQSIVHHDDCQLGDE